MLKQNNEYEFEIIDNGIEFEGIAKTEDGFTVFVPDTLKGEKILAKVVKLNKSYGVARPTKYILESKTRQDVDCEYYTNCGGCSTRHTTYDNSLDVKRQNVINTLKKLGIDESIVKDIYGMGNPYYYRNKVQYPVRQLKGKTVMGMFEKATHSIVENDYCLIQDETTHKIAKDMFSCILEEGLKGYDETTQKGDVRNIMVRRGIHTDECMCVLILNDKKLAQDMRVKNVVEKIVKNHDNITSFVVNLNEKNTNVILGDTNITVYGKDYITDYIGDSKFKITADSFFQVNTLQAEVLYNLLKEGLNLDKEKTLLELYSGVGSIGIFLADSVKDIYSVEIVESAVKAAKENAKLNNVKNIINVNGDATKETLKLVNEGKFFDYIVVDPPRKGLDLEGIELILKLKPSKIGYVSCNPATLARDLKLLENGGYEIKNIQLVDMFPWTSHVESCSVLKLKESTEIKPKTDMSPN